MSLALHECSVVFESQQVVVRPRFSIRKDKGGRLLPKHHSNLDPTLVGVKAFEHPAVKNYWKWLLEEYRPRHSVALVTPCSNVKPYTKSPTSRKIRGMLRHLGLWSSNEPRGIEWLYFSDLLILVPYQMVEDYPACCYEVPPDLVLGDKDLVKLVAGLLAKAMERLVDRGLERVIVFLSRKHLRLWDDARIKAASWPLETRVKYTLFSTKELAKAIEAVVKAGQREG